jgi:hypothetical protein
MEATNTGAWRSRRPDHLQRPTSGESWLAIGGTAGVGRVFLANAPDRSDLCSRLDAQLVQEEFGILQIRHVEALDEPAANWLQKRKSLNMSAFVMPMTRKASGGAELPPMRLLLPCNRQRSLQFSFRMTLLAQAKENFSPQAKQLGFKEPFARCFGQPRSKSVDARNDRALTWSSTPKRRYVAIVSGLVAHSASVRSR